MPRKGKRKAKRNAAPLAPVADPASLEATAPPAPPKENGTSAAAATSPPTVATAAAIVAAKLGELHLDSPKGSDDEGEGRIGGAAEGKSDGDSMGNGEGDLASKGEVSKSEAMEASETTTGLQASVKPTLGVTLDVKDHRGLVYSAYAGGDELQEIMALVDRELSEPYSIYTYRYFLVTWPEHCLVVRRGGAMIGCVVCKLEREQQAYAGYIAMLVVEKEYRGWGVGSKLVVAAIESMRNKGADEIVLETEVTNKGALRLYERMGFAREERLFRYYLNNNDAFRLKLWLN